MKLGDIYDFVVREGIKADLRKPQQIRKQLQVARKQYHKSTRSQKRFFDKEGLDNPYADTRILYGNRQKDIRRVLVGIDVDTSELLLAERLTRRGQAIDLVLSHHPLGKALPGLMDVMSLQADLYHHLGIEEAIARDLITQRIAEVTRRVHGGNYSRTVDAARLLDIPLMCCHTAADNHVAGYLQRLMDARRPRTLQAVVDLLLREPEYQQAAGDRMGPQILIGSPGDKAGRIFVDMTGGTEGSKEVFARLSQAGVATLISMHLSEAHFEKVKKEYVKVIVAGHMASDTLGMNLLLDKLARREDFEIIGCSGFRRFPR